MCGISLSIGSTRLLDFLDPCLCRADCCLSWRYLVGLSTFVSRDASVSKAVVGVLGGDTGNSGVGMYNFAAGNAPGSAGGAVCNDVSSRCIYSSKASIARILVNLKSPINLWCNLSLDAGRVRSLARSTYCYVHGT